MKIAYISGPIKADTDGESNKNFSRAFETAKLVRQLGYAVICPHEMGYHNPLTLSYDEWMKTDLKLLSVCDLCVLVETDYEKLIKSKGTIIELEFCLENSIPVCEVGRTGSWTGITHVEIPIVGKMIFDSMEVTDET